MATITEVPRCLLLDARVLPESTTLETDVCIVGGGAAGISVALQLAATPLRVCLIESGGVNGDSKAQALMRGECIGHTYFPLHQVRVSSFGGTTAIWAGACRPLDEIDFKERAWVPHSGWPIGRRELDPYYERAQELCQLGPYSYQVDDWETKSTPAMPLAPEAVETHIFQLSPPTRFGKAYRSLLSAPNVTTCVHATTVEIETDDTGRLAQCAVVAVDDGRRIRIAAKTFILAAGGIENARLLLLSKGACASRDGLGNQHDLVGRFFTEHLYIDSGQVILANGVPRSRLYGIHHATSSGSRARIEGVLAIAERELACERLLRCGFLFPPPWRTRSYYSNGMTSLLYLIRTLRVGHVPYLWPSHAAAVLRNLGDVLATTHRRLFDWRAPRDRMWVRAFGEQSPNPDSRVLLSDQRDRLGRNLVRLDWRVGDTDLRSIRKAHGILGRELERAGVGRLVAPFDEADAVWPRRLTGGYHHMGTTRMHADPKQGVVDANCKVHGTSNVFVTGSSVFPTAGYANPTLTIVGLALRLADHVKALHA
jgi:choline dehydrogenase-like flavoprotein